MQNTSIDNKNVQISIDKYAIFLIFGSPHFF